MYAYLKRPGSPERAAAEAAEAMRLELSAALNARGA
jgi:hypothetical protein